GNAEATAVVTQSVALLARVVKNCDGTVVKTLGDGLMAMFASPASAVMAVNVAARLLDHAGDNETLVTSTVLDALDPLERSRFRSLDRLQLRGRVEPVYVHLLEAHRWGDTAATAYGDILRAPEPEGIRLIWLDTNRVYSPHSLPVVLGRRPQATYCIDDSRVSRSHVRIDWHGGTFQLTDLSYYGTYVRFSGDSEIVSLRRGTCTLHGSGIIGLGSPPADASAPNVRFEVMK